MSLDAELCQWAIWANQQIAEIGGPMNVPTTSATQRDYRPMIPDDEPPPEIDERRCEIIHNALWWLQAEDAQAAHLIRKAYRDGLMVNERHLKQARAELKKYLSVVA